MDLTIKGMTCGHCKAAVEQALSEVAGVDTVTVDLENGKAQVTGEVTIQTLIDAVVEEGYEAQAATSAI